jgi:hypothetical protein
MSALGSIPVLQHSGFRPGSRPLVNVDDRRPVRDIACETYPRQWKNEPTKAFSILFKKTRRLWNRGALLRIVIDPQARARLLDERPHLVHGPHALLSVVVD